MDNRDNPTDLNEVLESFESTLAGILDSLLHKLNRSKSPESLFHYTNDAGLHGILESGKLRLTNIFNLNDPSELSHGLSHAVAILNSETKNGPSEAKDFAEKFARFYNEGIKHSAYYFVCSFSMNEHDLGQWRAYADNGRGYALEFDANKLAGDFSSKEDGSDDQRFSTFPVIYTDDEIINVQQQFISQLIPLISLPFKSTCKGLPTQEYLMHLSGILSLYTLEAAMYFKHKAYSNEAEFRFQQLFSRNKPINDVKFRARSSELVAYREFDWRGAQPKTLKRIVIGPATDQRKAKAFVTECLTAYHGSNWGDVEISFSPIPYRAV